MTLAQKGSVLMKFADDKVGKQHQHRGKLGQNTGKKWVTLKTNGGRLKFHGMSEEATHLGQTIGLTTSWKE